MDPFPCEILESRFDRMVNHPTRIEQPVRSGGPGSESDREGEVVAVNDQTSVLFSS